jgi:2-(1,2-epoxy-1,2-dihydrophenyl)acetyl-CoA isomerase
MTNSLLYTKDNGIARITLNRPDAYNSVTREMALAFQDALKDADKDKTVKVVLITGNGKAFCAGQDLNEILDEDKKFPIEKIVEEHFNPIVLLIHNLSKPVVAAVNGVAAGAGANIALLCDITVANESASFLQAFTKINLIPDSGGTYVLPRLIGFQKAIALALLGDKVSAAEADNMGMIYKYYPNDQFEEEVEKILYKLCSMPTAGLKYTKKLYNLGLDNDLATQLELERKYQNKAGNTKDYMEAVTAFVEKRKPNFTGE